jgi:UDP-glucose-4-epimerase GalE
MTILVTGGAGYIGSHTVRALTGRGRSVVVLDTLENGHRELIGETPLVVGDTSDPALVTSICADHGVDAVIHFAAYKAAGESMHDPAKYFRNNTAGSLELIEAVTRAGVRKFVFSSTAAVYGTPEEIPVVETAPLHPENPYGESKLMVERVLHWFDVAHGLRSVSLRYFNAAGAAMDGSIGEDWSHTENLVPVVMKTALERRPSLTIFGTDYPTPDGTGIRDYIHVEDLAEAHVCALDYLSGGGATTAVNLGTGIGTSVRQVIETTEQISGVRVGHELGPRRAGDPAALWADNRRAKELLGWEPVYSITDIIESAWRWHSNDPDRFAG